MAALHCASSLDVVSAAWDLLSAETNFSESALLEAAPVVEAADTLALVLELRTVTNKVEVKVEVYVLPEFVTVEAISVTLVETDSAFSVVAPEVRVVASEDRVAVSEDRVMV